MLKSGVYQWRNTVTDKVYVGSSINVLKRGYIHQWALRQNKHPNQKLQRAWNKYGEHSFEFSVLESCTHDQLLRREQYWLDHKYAAVNGYNMAPIAGNTAGRKFSATSKMLIGQKSRERNQGVKHPMFGRKHSVEMRQRMSEVRRGVAQPKLQGRVFSAETKAKLRAAAIARPLDGRRNPYYGCKHSDKTRAKMRAAWQRRRAPEEVAHVGNVQES